MARITITTAKFSWPKKIRNGIFHEKHVEKSIHNAKSSDCYHIKEGANMQ